MCRQRHINDSVLSSLKMEGIRLLLLAFALHELLPNLNLEVISGQILHREANGYETVNVTLSYRYDPNFSRKVTRSGCPTKHDMHPEWPLRTYMKLHRALTPSTKHNHAQIVFSLLTHPQFPDRWEVSHINTVHCTSTINLWAAEFYI
jgi:hypothetical protein